jgi:hypothetical protein
MGGQIVISFGLLSGSQSSLSIPERCRSTDLVVDCDRRSFGTRATRQSGDSLKRHHIPGVLDVFETSDPQEIEAINADPRFDRKFDSRACPLNWLLLKRSLSVLSYAGNRFPTMKPRESNSRKSDQEALWNRLDLKVPQVKLGPEELEPLSDWVRGHGAEESLGMRA